MRDLETRDLETIFQDLSDALNTYERAIKTHSHSFFNTYDESQRRRISGLIDSLKTAVDTLKEEAQKGISRLVTDSRADMKVEDVADEIAKFTV